MVRYKMEQALTKTGLPLLIDSNIASTVDFHISSSSLINIVDEYADYIATAYLRNHQMQTADPVYNDAIFFLGLNDDMLSFKTPLEDADPTLNTDGYNDARQNKRVVESFAKGAYLSNLDALLEENEVWVRGEDNWPEVRGSEDGKKQYELTYASGKKEIVPESQYKTMNLERSGTTVKELPIEYHAVNLLTNASRWVPYESNLKALVETKLNRLTDEFGVGKMENEFILYWRDKFDRCHPKTKELYKGLMEADSMDMFSEISDSIGMLGTAALTPDTAMLPYCDNEYNLLGAIPAVNNDVASSKLDTETRTLIEEMSLKTDGLFKRNMIPMISQIKLSTEAHGVDLMTDYQHYARMIGLQSRLDAMISEAIGKAYKMIEFIKQATNKQKIESPTITLAVEDTSSRVNILKEKINLIPNTRTNDSVLKAGRVTDDRS